MTTVPVSSVAIRPFDALAESLELVRSQYWLMLGITLVGWLISSIVPFWILTGPMMCGIFLCYFKLMRGEKVVFEDLFKGLDYFVQSLIATLIMIAVTVVLAIPMCIAIAVAVFSGIGSSSGDVNAALGATLALLMTLVFIVILALFFLVGITAMFAYALIVDRGLNAIDALTTGLRATLANVWGMLGLLIIVSVIMVVALFLCVLPYILVTPIVMGALAVAYRRVFPEIAG